MIVCSCFGTTDREIRAAFGPGGDRRCPAGRGCGGCRRLVQSIANQAADPARTDGAERRSAPRRDSI